MANRTIAGCIIAALLIGLSPKLSLAAEAACPPMLNHRFANLMDEPVSLCQYRGKVLLVVNTASECGYTPQYDGLEKSTAATATKASWCWASPQMNSADRSRGRTKRSRNFAR